MSERAIAEKKKVVDTLKEKITKAKVMILSECPGFTVKDVTILRKKLRPEDAEFRIVKNTLLERAVLASGLSQMKDCFKGQTGVLWGYKDAVSPLKILVGFLKEAEKGTIKAGVVESAVFGGEEIKKIALLPSREALLAKMVGGFQAPLRGLVNVLQGPIRKLVYALDQIKIKKGGE